MSPAVRRERADTSLTSNTKFGLQKPMEVLRVFKIMVGVIFSHIPAGVVMRASGVEGDDLWALGWTASKRRADFGHKRGYTDTL